MPLGRSSAQVGFAARVMISTARARAFDRPRQARTEQAVDDQRRRFGVLLELLHARFSELVDRDSERAQCIEVRACIAGYARGIADQHAARANMASQELPCDDPCVATVLPFPPHDQHTRECAAIVLEQVQRRAEPRVLHEHEPRHAQTLDGVTIERAHLLAREQGQHQPL